MKSLPTCSHRGPAVGIGYQCWSDSVPESVVPASQCMKCPLVTTQRKEKGLILQCHLPPGDQLTLTAAVESLHRSYPGVYRTGIKTSAPELWENNPHIVELDKSEAKTIHMHYDLVNSSNQHSVVFLEGYTLHLSQKLGIPLRLVVNRPYVYLSDEEKSWENQVSEHFTNGRSIPFWMINAGIKTDYTAKAWPVESYQAVVDALRGIVQFVQIGSSGDEHPQLRGVINLVGQTSLREMCRLAYHSQGGVGPVTFLQHLCAAFEKPYICIAGGREPLPWITSYPKQTTLHTIGALDCCRDTACWRSKVVPRSDKDKDLCQLPVLGLERPVAKCMAMIPPAEVCSIIARYNQAT